MFSHVYLRESRATRRCSYYSFPFSKSFFYTQHVIKMTTQEGEDINKPFLEKDWMIWIGRGQIYNTTTIPTYCMSLLPDPRSQTYLKMSPPPNFPTPIYQSLHASCRVCRPNWFQVKLPSGSISNHQIYPWIVQHLSGAFDQALPHIEVTSDMDMEHFKVLKEGKNELISALKLSRKRGGDLNWVVT